MLGLYEEEAKLFEEFWEATRGDIDFENPPSLDEMTEKWNQFLLPRRQNKIQQFTEARNLISSGISRAGSFTGKLFIAIILVASFYLIITDVLNVDPDMDIFLMMGYVSLALLIGFFLLKIYNSYFDYQTKRFLKIAVKNPSYTDFLHLKLNE